MNKVDELMGYAFQFAWEYHATNTCREGPRKLMLMDALTAALAEKDARIAELEGAQRPENEGEPDSAYPIRARKRVDADEQAFLDAAAIACMASYSSRSEEDYRYHDDRAAAAFNAAHALLAERRKRMVQP